MCEGAPHAPMLHVEIGLLQDFVILPLRAHAWSLVAIVGAGAGLASSRPLGLRERPCPRLVMILKRDGMVGCQLSTVLAAALVRIERHQHALSSRAVTTRLG